MTPRVFFLVLALVAAPMAAIAQEGGARVSITAPAEGARLTTSTVVVNVDVQGHRLVDPRLTADAREGEGHLYVTVDGKGVRGAWEGASKTASKSVLVTGLRAGPHVIRVEARNGADEPLEPRVYDEVNVTVAPDSPYVYFREGKPWPGMLTGGSVRAEVDFQRGAGLPISRTEVRWSLDGTAQGTTTATWFEYPNIIAGVHKLRADLLVDGEAKAYDELLVGVPELRFSTKPASNAVAGQDLAPASLSYALDLDGATLTDHHLRLLVDGEPVPGEAQLSGSVDVPVGDHVVAAQLLGADMEPVAPVVGTAVRVHVDPPPPEVRFDSPKELATVLPKFIAVARVSNLTLVVPGGALEPTEGHVHWYLDGEKVADAPDKTHKFEGLSPGLHTVEVRLADNAEKEFGPKAVRKFNVEGTPPQESTGDGAGERVSPAGAFVGALAALGAAALARRR